MGKLDAIKEGSRKVYTTTSWDEHVLDADSVGAILIQSYTTPLALAAIIGLRMDNDIFCEVAPVSPQAYSALEHIVCRAHSMRVGACASSELAAQYPLFLVSSPSLVISIVGDDFDRHARREEDERGRRVGRFSVQY